jgi:hypothetical protein
MLTVAPGSPWGSRSSCMLYPMAERALAVDWPELREQLDAFELG